jgi:YidC/Oxa1 family membrane protein insertase
VNNNQSDSKNFLIAMLAFAVIMLGYNYFFEEGRGKNAEQQVASNSEGIEEVARPELTLSEALSKNSRIRIENEKIYGSIDLVGGIIDNVSLKEYREGTDGDSPDVMLLTPRGTHSEYYHQISYRDRMGGEVDGKTVWTVADSNKDCEAVILKTRTPGGLIIERTVTTDGYLIHIKDKIFNTSGSELNIRASSDLFRTNPKHGDHAVVYDGIIGNTCDGIKEIKYSDVDQNTLLNDCEWFGYTDIYWLCAIINKDKDAVASCAKLSENSYKCSTSTKNELRIKPEAEIELSYSIFVGPKDINVLQKCADKLKLHKFDMAIDFGWFFMVTKPLLQAFGFLGGLLKSMWIVILLLTLLFKIATYPLTKKSFASIARMREVQPRIAALQKMYANDKVRLNQELISIYKKEGISPMSGCLPMLLQAPIFFCLYKVFYISIEMRHAPLFWWVRDLSSPDQAYIFNLFGAIDWTPPGVLRIGVWPLIMGLTMLAQQKMASSISSRSKIERTSEQKTQENMMLIMPVVFTYICASCPVGVVVYWTISNVFSIVQQYYVNKYVAKNNQRV